MSHTQWNRLCIVHRPSATAWCCIWCSLPDPSHSTQSLASLNSIGQPAALKCRLFWLILPYCLPLHFLIQLVVSVELVLCTIPLATPSPHVPRFTLCCVVRVCALNTCTLPYYLPVIVFVSWCLMFCVSAPVHASYVCEHLDIHCYALCNGRNWEYKNTNSKNGLLAN